MTPEVPRAPDVTPLDATAHPSPRGTGGRRAAAHPSPRGTGARREECFGPLEIAYDFSAYET
ncbi:hypothetical protein ABT132_36950, partial [Streptomyces mirabilis]